MQNAWKEAARAWWERMREAERERDELRARAEGWLTQEELMGSALERESRWRKDAERKALEWERAVEESSQERDELLQKVEELQASLDDAFLQLAHEPSNIPGEFADLAKRIAEADAKHPRDLVDGGWASRIDSAQALTRARYELRSGPSWSNALRCEVEEAMYDLAWRKDLAGVADELLDVATVAMRWRRAVMERGSK